MVAWREMQECYKNGKLAMLVQPKESFSWDMPLAREVGSYTDSRYAEFCLSCAGGAYRVDMTLLTNSDEVFKAFNLGPCAGCHAPLLLELLETHPDEHSYEDLFWPFSFVQRFGDAVRDDYQKRYPEDYCEGVTESDFIQRALSGSTKRLQRASVMAEVTAEIQAWSARMIPGEELAHLKELVASTDYKGSDAELLTSTPFRELRQRVPYPAYRWQWQTRDAWRWKHEQHINVLEVQAFLQHLRTRVRKVEHHGQRFLHVLDSTMATGVLAKGRSSSKRLNRLCQRVAAWLLATEQYALYLWTISAWKYSDKGSRVHRA